MNHRRRYLDRYSYLNFAMFHWSALIKTGKWAVIYMCVRGYRFCLFIRFFVWILKLFRQCGLFFILLFIYYLLGFVLFYVYANRIGWVMISVLATSVVDRGFERGSSQAKDYDIGICCLSTKHEVLRSKITDLLTRNQNNVFECSDMSTRGLLFQCKNPTKSFDLKQSGHHHHCI